MLRVPVKPELLRWARQRAGLSQADLIAVQRFKLYGEWETGKVQPTLKQLEAFAKRTHTPIGYFFLAKPPRDELPIADFRTMGSRELVRPSPDLLDTIGLCQLRQDWYRDYARSNREDPLAFVGSVTVEADPVATAAVMRRILGFDLDEQRRAPTWTEALRQLIRKAEDAGVLVMVSGVVGSNTHRKLDPSEFRGLALVDDLAPLIFVNGADTKAAQMFTCAHELAHLWLGESGVSNAKSNSFPARKVERWCNQVAAEFLVPLSALQEVPERQRRAPLQELQPLARRYKVSTLVILRRIHDAGWISREALREAYDEELRRLLALTSGGGGNFYLTQPVRLSRRFATALVGSAVSGRTLYRDAFRLLGVKKVATVHELGRNLGLPI